MLTLESLLPSRGTTGSRVWEFEWILSSLPFIIIHFHIIFSTNSFIIETVFIRKNLILVCGILREDSSQSSNIFVPTHHLSLFPKKANFVTLLSPFKQHVSIEFWENSLLVVEPVIIYKPRAQTTTSRLKIHCYLHRFPCGGQTRPSRCVDTLSLSPSPSPEQNSFAPSTRHLYSH